MNLYLLMEADCIIHSAGASECAGNRMYDGWPRWRSSPLSLRWAVHLFICLFIYSLIQRDAQKNSGFVLRRRRRRKSVWQLWQMLPLLHCLLLGWLWNRHLGQDFTLPALVVPSYSVFVRKRTIQNPSIHFVIFNFDFTETSVETRFACKFEC